MKNKLFIFLVIFTCFNPLITNNVEIGEYLNYTCECNEDDINEPDVPFLMIYDNQL